MFATNDQLFITESVAAARVCDLLHVSRSEFYSWTNEQRTDRENKDRELLPLAQDIFWDQKRRYSARRIQRQFAVQSSRPLFSQ